MRIAIFAFAVSMMPIIALAEMPMTIVTPDNAASQDVRFVTSIAPYQQGNLVRITLTVKPQTTKYEEIGQPGLYLYRGDRSMGRVALYANEPKDLDRDCLAASTITVPCYPNNPDFIQDPDTQSMEYTLKLSDFAQE